MSLSKIKALLAKATKGPWTTGTAEEGDTDLTPAKCHVLHGPDWGSFAVFVTTMEDEAAQNPIGMANVQLAAELVSIAPALIARLELLEGAVQKATEMFSAADTLAKSLKNTDVSPGGVHETVNRLGSLEERCAEYWKLLLVPWPKVDS